MCEYCDEYDKFRVEQEFPIPTEFQGVPQCTTSQIETVIKQRELRTLASATERWGGSEKVYAANIVNHREDYKSLTVYATIHVRINNTEFSGCQLIEGHIHCASLSELSAVVALMLTGYAVIIDKSSLEILETTTY